MAANAYLDRLNQLQQKKEQALEDRGLPIQRPTNRQPVSIASNPKPEEPAQEQPDMSTMFGKNLDYHTGQDSRFGDMIKEYTQLANSLGYAVRNGQMPEPIAKQRLQEYLDHSRSYFQQNQPTPMDNPQISGVINQFLQNRSAQGQDQQPQEADNGNQ